MAAGDGLIRLCASDELHDAGRGVRFEVTFRGEQVPAFAVRHRGIAVAYLNRCSHVSMELDWQPGEFFEPDGEFLICSTHGALYDPASGECRGGACSGRGNLRALSVVERDGAVYWMPDAQAEPIA